MQPPLSFPTEFLARVSRIYPEPQAQQVIDGLSKQRATTLRINTLKTTKEQLLSQAETEGILLEPSGWYNLAYTLVRPDLRKFEQSKIYTEGWCYVQNFSSMIPPITLNPQPGERILDIAAAPGSKTSQIAMIMNNTGEILANDSSPVRIYRLLANLNRLGITTVTIRRGAGQSLWQDYPEYFDRALVDVPCSMEGRFMLDDPATYDDWTPRKIKELIPIQKFLLRSAVSATKVGGTIVYSTCTLAPEENEGVVDWVLKKEGGNIIVEDCMLSDGVPGQQPILEWKEKHFSSEIARSRRVFPSDHFEGFYIAKLKKVGSSVPSAAAGFS